MSTSEANELVPAEAGVGALFANSALQALSHFLDQLVPGGMAQGILDELQPVHIDKKDRHSLPGRLKLSLLTATLSVTR